jgi:hypothetical protein
MRVKMRRLLSIVKILLAFIGLLLFWLTLTIWRDDHPIEHLILWVIIFLLLVIESVEFYMKSERDKYKLREFYLSAITIYLVGITTAIALFFEIRGIILLLMYIPGIIGYLIGYYFKIEKLMNEETIKIERSRLKRGLFNDSAYYSFGIMAITLLFKIQGLIILVIFIPGIIGFLAGCYFTFIKKSDPICVRAAPQRAITKKNADESLIH